MNAVIALTLIILGDLAVNPTAPLDEAKVLAKYEKECVKKNKKVTDACKEQKALVEIVYFQSFRRLTASRKKGTVERKYMVLAAQANNLALRELGLWTLAAEGSKGPLRRGPHPEPGFLTPPEQKLYIAELNSPYPALRGVAWKALRIGHRSRKSKTTDERNWGVDHAYRTEFGTPFWPGAPQGLSADRAPDADDLRAKPYPKSQIQYYASGRGGAVWLTDDSVEQVRAHYKKQGLQSMAMQDAVADGFMKLYDAKIREMAKGMKSGKDPHAIEREMKSVEALTKKVAPKYIFAGPKDQFLIGKEFTVERTKMIAYDLVVWRSKELKKTGIAIHFKGRK